MERLHWTRGGEKGSGRLFPTGGIWDALVALITGHLLKAALFWQSPKMFFFLFLKNWTSKVWKAKLNPLSIVSLFHFFPSTITHSALLFEGLTHHHRLVTPNYSTLFLLIPPFFVSLSFFSFTLLVQFSASKYLDQCDISLHWMARHTISASERSVLRSGRHERWRAGRGKRRGLCCHWDRAETVSFSFRKRPSLLVLAYHAASKAPLASVVMFVPVWLLTSWVW